MSQESLNPKQKYKFEDLLNNEQKKAVKKFKSLVDEFIQDSDPNAYIRINQYFWRHRPLPIYISETLGHILEDHKNTVAGFELEYIRYQGKRFFDAEAAFRCYKKAAERGDKRAQMLLANCYSEGMGAAEDCNKAMEWWEKAAKQGYARAQRNLANAYMGRGDLSNARAWYIKALAKGHGYAHAEVGSLLEEGKMLTSSQVRAIFFYRIANRYDIADGAYRLARCYERGKGVEQDLIRAVKLYRKAAHRGHIQAQYELGLFYKAGQGGLEKNFTQALKWFRRSAKQGYAPAQYMLGLTHEHGEGVVPNPEKAKYWYEKAAKQGDTGSCSQLGVLLLQKDPKKYARRALKLLKKAAEQGNVVAQAHLETYLQNSIPVDKQPAEQIVPGYHLTQSKEKRDSRDKKASHQTPPTAAHDAQLLRQTPSTAARDAYTKTRAFLTSSHRRIKI